MGGLNRRLEHLEDHSRATAAAEVRRAWDRQTNAEVALILAPFRFDREPTPEETAAEEAFREGLSEDVIARAIGLREEMDEGEQDRHLSELMASVLERRRRGVERELALIEGGAWGD